MEPWGADLYGQPCRGCGWSWLTTPHDAVAYVAGFPGLVEAALSGATGRERDPGLAWSAGEYVSHVADNLRTWSERLAGVLGGGDPRVSGYDPDLLAAARRYDTLDLPAALWSLHRSAEAWVDVLTRALDTGVVLDHATRGPQQAADVARNNAHDAHHHLDDVARCLRA